MNEVQRLKSQVDNAYRERNMLVVLLASIYPSGKKKTAIEGWDELWLGCVYIDFPWGQGSWHYHDSDAWMFDHLKEYEGVWDGHSTDEKYRNILSQARLRYEYKQVTEKYL